MLLPPAPGFWWRNLRGPGLDVLQRPFGRAACHANPPPPCDRRALAEGATPRARDKSSRDDCTERRANCLLRNGNVLAPAVSMCALFEFLVSSEHRLGENGSLQRPAALVRVQGLFSQAARPEFTGNVCRGEHAGSSIEVGIRDFGLLTQSLTSSCCEASTKMAQDPAFTSETEKIGAGGSKRTVTDPLQTPLNCQV